MNVIFRLEITDEQRSIFHENVTDKPSKKLASRAMVQAALAGALEALCTKPLSAENEVPSSQRQVAHPHTDRILVIPVDCRDPQAYIRGANSVRKSLNKPLFIEFEYQS